MKIELSSQYNVLLHRRNKLLEEVTRLQREAMILANEAKIMDAAAFTLMELEKKEKGNA